jgi:hypothetical protein
MHVAVSICSAAAARPQQTNFIPGQVQLLCAQNTPIKLLLELPARKRLLGGF